MNRYAVAIVMMAWSFCGTASVLDGCVNSPENPTAVLGVLGLAAAGMPWLGTKLRQRVKYIKQTMHKRGATRN